MLDRNYIVCDCLNMETKSNKQNLVQIRMSDSEKAAIEKASKQASLPLSTWVRMVSVREAGGIPDGQG